MKSRYYVLKNGVVTGTDDMFEWGTFFEETAARRVDFTQVGELEVSTVFLGLDHNCSGEGAPVLFETMVFDKDRQGIGCRRYSTYGEAHAGHWEVVEELRENSDDAIGRNC